MSSVILTKVYRDTVETKYGMRAKVAIQTDKHGEKWLSALFPTNATLGTESWQVGDEVAIDVQEKGDFLNFKPSGGGSRPSINNPSLESRVVRLEERVFGSDNTGLTAPAVAATDEPVIQADDLPDFGEEADAGDGF